MISSEGTLLALLFYSKKKILHFAFATVSNYDGSIFD